MWCFVVAGENGPVRSHESWQICQNTRRDRLHKHLRIATMVVIWRQIANWRRWHLGPKWANVSLP
jgi:hypothetical protein